MRSPNITFLSYIRESASRISATQNIWLSPAMLSLLTSFYSFLLCFFSASAGLTWSLCQTWGFWPNSTRIKWLENHRGPFQMSVIWSWHTASLCLCRQWKDQMCLYTWIKNMHDVLSVYDKTVNLNGSVYMLQILSDLYTARPLAYLAVASCVDMGLWGDNICYLTQINAQREASGAVQGKKVLVFAMGYREGG